MAQANENNDEKITLSTGLIKEIIKAVNNLKYGSVTLVVHNSQIIQIDTTEKLRFSR